MGLDQAKWSQTYKFAQTVLKYYEKVCVADSVVNDEHTQPPALGTAYLSAC